MITFKFNKKKAPEDWQFMTNRLQRCSLLKQRGIKLGIATNQGGVAFNYCTEEQLYPELLMIQGAIQAESLRVCYHHPKGFRTAYKGDCEDRKPNPGMLLKIMKELEINPSNTLMVGDMESDEEASFHAQCHYCDAKTFFEEMTWA